MNKRVRRTRSIPRLEAFEDRTLLSGVGVNMGINYQYQGDPVWTNVSRLMGAWSYVDATKWTTANPNVKTNSLGSPLSDASAYVYLQNYPDGVYNVSFKGSVTIDFFGVGHLAAPLVKGADGVTRGQVVVDASFYQDALRPLIMNVTNINAADPLAELKIIAPGYPADGSQIYTSEILRDLQPFDNIRFMDWELTNNSQITSWSQRGQSNQITGASLTGRPIDYESMIDLGNQTGNDIWLNVPALADDDFIKNLADLVRDKLKPGLKAYIEYSNETWNGYFGQYNQVLTASKSNPLITATDAMTRVSQQSAFMTKKISDIFRQEFGAGFDRVVPVFGSWAAVSNWTTIGLQFVKDHYGAPSQYIKSVAVAPYLGIKKGTDSAKQTVEGLINSLLQNISVNAPLVSQSVKAAAAFGIPLDAYEGGTNILSIAASSSVKFAAQDDPRMYDVYKAYMTMWRDQGGGLIDLYTYSGDIWGLKQRLSYPGSQKYDAVVSMITPAGDASLDGKVDFADFQILAANYGKTGLWWEQGDFNHDAKVDADDLDALRANIDVGSLTSDQAAQLATFGRPPAIADGTSVEFDLFGKDYLSDLDYAVSSGSAVADGVYNGVTGGAGTAKLGGTAYAKGLGVSSNSRINASLKGAYTTFYATIGVDDRAGSGVGKTIFKVLGDGKTLYTSPAMSGGASPISIEVSVNGVSVLQLVTSVTGGASSTTPADWAMARLVDTAPISTSSQTTLAWTVTKDGKTVSSSSDDSFVFAPSGPGTYIVSVQATDPRGAKASRSVSIDAAPGSSATSAAYVGSNSSTKGNWKGAFGGAGYSLAGSDSSLPDYSWMRVSGQSATTWSTSTTDVRGLEKAPSYATDRIARAWAGSSFKIDVGFADGLTHVVSLYALDWDNKGRSERIDVVDAATGKVLDSRTIGSFTNGVYLTWNVGGQVQFVVTKLAGTNAVVSGLFLDGVASGAFVAEDDSTQGRWEGVYGSQGYQIVNGKTSLPAYVAAVEMAGATISTSAWSGTNEAGAQTGDAATDARSFSAWAATEFVVDVLFTDNLVHRMSMYAFDPTGGRVQRVDLLDPYTGAVIDSRTISNFTTGTYLSWDVSGHVRLRFTKVAGTNALCSGILFDPSASPTPPPDSGSDPASTASFDAKDATTQGSWKGSYGSGGYGIAGDGTSYPSYAGVDVVGASLSIWSPDTQDARALQKSAQGSTSRIASTWYNSTSFTIDVDLSDDAMHRVSLYLLDCDNKNRSERIDVVDAATGSVLDSRTVSSFTNGVYLSWDVKGSVRFVVTRLTGDNAVVSAVFID